MLLNAEEESIQMVWTYLKRAIMYKTKCKNVYGPSKCEGK